MNIFSASSATAAGGVVEDSGSPGMAMVADIPFLCASGALPSYCMIAIGYRTVATVPYRTSIILYLPVPRTIPV